MDYLVTPFIRLMKVLGLETLTLLDVGARWGIDQRWNALGDRLKIVGFEPDPEECRRLNERAQPNFKAYPLALSDKAGSETIHLAREPGRSSLLQPNRRLLKRYPDHEGFEIVSKVQVSTDTLDHFLQETHIPHADFAKLDVQGGELKILEGGFQTLREKLFGLQIEVEFSEIYEGQPLFADIDALCRRAGFVLFDLKPCYWKRRLKPIRGVGQLIFGDALYFKDYIQMNFVPNGREAAAAIVLSALYGKNDYALELLHYFYEKKVFSLEVFESAEKILVRLSKLPFLSSLNFRGRYRMANFLGRFSQFLKTSYWARWDDWQR